MNNRKLLINESNYNLLKENYFFENKIRKEVKKCMILFF